MVYQSNAPAKLSYEPTNTSLGKSHLSLISDFDYLFFYVSKFGDNKENLPSLEKNNIETVYRFFEIKIYSKYVIDSSLTLVKDV